MADFTCRNCGKTFQARAIRIYCSRKCANVKRGQQAQRWATYCCVDCGIEVRVKPAGAKIYKYCSSCRAKRHGQRLDQAQRLAGHRKDPVTKICPQCRKEFITLACNKKIHCSRSCANAARIGQPSRHRLTTQNSSGVSGFRSDLNMYFRSRWEANYARYLHFMGKKFRYEPHRFIVCLPDGTKHSYIPDFFVEEACYIEVKGWMRPNQAAIIEAAKQQLQQPLQVLDAMQYRTLQNEIAAKIQNWEYAGDSPPKHLKRYCPVCHELVHSHKTIYCSSQCFGVAIRKPKELKYCEICGKEMLLSPWESEKRFCTVLCKASWQSQYCRGSNSPNYGHKHSAETRAKISNAKRGSRYSTKH